MRQERKLRSGPVSRRAHSNREALETLRSHGNSVALFLSGPRAPGTAGPLGPADSVSPPVGRSPVEPVRLLRGQPLAARVLDDVTRRAAALAARGVDAGPRARLDRRRPRLEDLPRA